MKSNRYYFKDKTSVLRSLSDSQLEKAIDLYQSGSPVKDIKQELGIKTNQKEFYSLLPYEKSFGCLCGARTYIKLSPRHKDMRVEFLCPSCGLDSVEFGKRQHFDTANMLSGLFSDE